MKRNLLAITMCIIVVFTLAGCDSKTSEVQNDNLNSNNQTMANSTNKNKNYSKIKFSEMYETKDGVKNISEIYKSLDGKAEKLKSIRRLAKDIIAEHGKETDWPKWSDLKETMTLDEAHTFFGPLRT